MKSLATLLLAVPLSAQTAPSPAPDPFQSLHFLEGTWTANATGPNGVSTTGRYTFARELDGHLLARHSTTDPACTAPSTFDCKHGDLLYLFPEAGSLHAIYFDTEGHTLRYTVTTPTSTSAIFLSDPAPGPRFRLVYELQGTILAGRFQLQPPGQTTWRSYLEWSGTRQ